jgi:hypothetical protein
MAGWWFRKLSIATPRIQSGLITFKSVQIPRHKVAPRPLGSMAQFSLALTVAGLFILICIFTLAIFAL